MTLKLRSRLMKPPVLAVVLRTSSRVEVDGVKKTGWEEVAGSSGVGMVRYADVNGGERVEGLETGARGSGVAR